MNKLDKVRAPVDGKYVPAIVNYTENAKGFRRSYDYVKVEVEFEDGTKRIYNEWDLIPVLPKPTKGKSEVDKPVT